MLWHFIAWKTRLQLIDFRSLKKIVISELPVSEYVHEINIDNITLCFVYFVFEYSKPTVVQSYLQLEPKVFVAFDNISLFFLVQHSASLHYLHKYLLYLGEVRIFKFLHLNC